MTVALQVPLPPVPSAVMVYVVATRGLTEMLPPEVGVVLPMPLLMLTEVLPCSDWDEVEVAASSVGTIESAAGKKEKAPRT